MISYITRWLNNRADTLRIKYYTRGYDWAAGQILRDELNIGQLEFLIHDCWDDTDYISPYQQGVRDAISTLRPLVNCNANHKT